MPRKNEKFEMDGFKMNRSQNDFSNPDRRKKREELYKDVLDDLRRHNSMLAYDKYSVLQLLIHKIRDGRL